MVREHVEKGDPREVANFCMFLWRLGKPISDAALPMGKRAPAQQAVTLTDPEQIAKSFLSQEDSAALFMFHSQAHDSDADGYTERAETMDRLAELGVVQRLPGRGRRFGVTAFGDWLIEAEFAQKPLLPLRTIAEHNSREKAGHALYLKESAPHSTAWVKLARAERESWRRKAALQSHSHSEGERRG